MATDKRVLLGHIRGAHGIRGEVIIHSYTDDPAAIASYGPLTDEGGTRTVTIATARVTAKGVVAQLKGITNRTAAEALRGMTLTVARSALPEADDGDYYHADLVGLAARTEDGAVLGKVIAVQNFGAGDLLEVQLVGTKRTELYPFTDACVPTIDMAAGTVVIVPPPTTEAKDDDASLESTTDVE